MPGIPRRKPLVYPSAATLATAFYSEERPISTPFTENERQRFRNLLELANSSPYQGERDNAMAAAERLAGRHGMTLGGSGARRDPEPETRAAAPARSRKCGRSASWRASST